jgi:putative phage-type endonuclease
MAKKYDLEQGTPEWHDFRSKHIGASEAPVIMGESPWATPIKLWKERLGLIEKKADNAFMKRGRDLESQALEAFNNKMGSNCQPAVFESDKYPFIAASLDGYDSDQKLIVEIKCPGQEDHLTACLGEVPAKYKWQLYQQMYVMGLDAICYASYRDGNIVVVPVQYNKNYEKTWLSKTIKFWECLENFEEPEAIPSDLKCIETQEWEVLATKYKSANALMKKYKDESDEIKEQLKLIAGESAQGGGITLVKSLVRGTVDYKAIPELATVDLEKYRKKQIEKWTIREL